MNTVSKEDFESTCKLFIGAVHKYFGHLNKVKAASDTPNSETGVPYVKEPGDIVLKEFTGMIGISGNRKGIVYFSGQREIFVDLLKIFTRLEDITDERVLDMAGEVSNVIAGNVRETFGQDFMISVPIVFQGKPANLKFPENVPVFVIPIKWKSYEAYMVIGLE